VWRLVLEGMASLHEVETHWTITDVLDANEALDVQGDVTEWHRRRAREENATASARAHAIRGGR
jgi:hypothetical protein